MPTAAEEAAMRQDFEVRLLSISKALAPHPSQTHFRQQITQIVADATRKVLFILETTKRRRKNGKKKKKKKKRTSCI